MDGKTYCLSCIHRRVCGWYPHTKADGIDCKEFLSIDYEEFRSVEPLTDEEQRIFLAAMSREKKLCQNIEELWDQLSLTSDDDIDLVKSCEEVVRKVKKVLWTEELENGKTDY